MSARKTLLIVFAIAYGVASAALYPASAARTTAPQAQAAKTAALSAERIARHVQYLASDQLQGRRAGTPAAAEAARYIEKEFRSYGLKPASAAGYQQAFTFVARVELGKANRFEVKDASGAHAYKVGAEFMPLAFSSAEPAAGDVVFAGYGISAPELQYDSYAGVDVKGRVVMILRGSTDGDNPHGRFAEYTAPGMEIQKKTLKAREKGARGVIFVSEEQVFQHDRLSRLHHDLNFLDAGIPTVVISRATANAILKDQAAASTTDTMKDALAQAKAKGSAFVIAKASVDFKTDVTKINDKSANVVGVLQGSDPQLASEYVVIGAHYDHLGLGGPESLAANPDGQIHHGADDNASGTSGLLELARVMAEHRADYKRSIVFIAFSGEELGLLGSAAYAKTPLVPLAASVAMLNMDMIGRLRNGGLFIGGVGTSPVWKPLIEKLNGASDATHPSMAHGPASRFQLSYGQDGFGPSDHQSFYVKDLPVLFFFTGTHEDYHKPSDTANKINNAGIAEVAEFVREIALAVSNEPQRLAFTRVKVESKPTSGGFRVYLGTIPNYADQSDGMKLDGVRPGSPGERAGLKADDLVIRLAKTPIKNVYDYTYALGELRPGEEVEIVVRRNGQEMTLKITPDKRQ